MANQTELSIVIRAKNAAQATLAQLDSQFKDLAASAQKYHAELRNVGLSLTAVSAIGVGSMTIATKAAGDLELQMFNVRKTTDMAAQEIAKLKQSFIDMSAHLPVSAVELAKIGAIAGQLGVNGRKNIESFTETVAMISTVTDLTVENAANSMARLANLFHLPMADIRKLGGVINEMENTTTAKASNMVEFMLRMATSAKTLGMKAPDVAGLAATLVDLGFNAELAGTAVSNAFNDMIKDADKFGLSMGMSGAQFRKGMETDAIGTFQKWAQAMKALPKEEMLRTFDELGLSASRETSVFMTLVGAVDKLTVNTAAANKEFLLGTSLQKEFDTFMQATWNQVKLLTNVLAGLATMFGDVLLPALKSIVMVGQEVFLWLKGLPEWARTAVVGIVILGTSLTGLLGGLALLGAILPSLQSGLALIGTMAVAAAPALGTLAVSIGGAVAASVPLLGALAAAIGGVIWAWVEWKKTEPAKEEEKALEATKKNTKAIQDKTAAINQMKASALSAQNALDDAFKTLGVAQVEKEIKVLKDAYKTLEASGKATSEELSQAWDNMQEKIKKLKGEAVDPLGDALKLLGLGSLDNLEKLESAYQTVKESGEGSAVTIMNAWIRLNDEQEKTNNFAKAWEGFISSRVLPAVNAYVSAMQAGATAEAAASRTVFDAKLRDIADSAKNAGNSIEAINAKIAGKFSEGAQIARSHVQSFTAIREAANAYADDLDRIVNAEIGKYRQVIAHLREIGATDRQVREYEIAAAEKYLGLMDARLSAERSALAQMIKIRDENLASYRQSQEAIKQLKDQAADVDKKSQDLKDALADKNFTAEENAVRQTLRMRMQMYDTENMANDRKMKVLGEIGQKAAQVAMAMKAGSTEEYQASVLAQEAYAKEKELIAKVAEEKRNEGDTALKAAKKFELSIAKQQELVSGLATTVQNLNKVMTDAKLEAKITLLDEALAPAKKLKAELKDNFKDAIIQKVILQVDKGAEALKSSGLTDGLTAEEVTAFNAALAHQNGTDGASEDGNMPSYDRGISYVPRDQVARIHQGEAVLTREENARYRAGKSGNVTFGDIVVNVPPGVRVDRATAMEIRRELARIDKRVAS